MPTSTVTTSLLQYQLQKHSTLAQKQPQTNTLSTGECSGCGDTSQGQGTNHPQAEHSPTEKWAVVYVTKRAISKQAVRQKNKHSHLMSLSWVTLTQLWTALFPPRPQSTWVHDCTTEFLADTWIQTWIICYAEAET